MGWRCDSSTAGGDSNKGVWNDSTCSLPSVTPQWTCGAATCEDWLCIPHPHASCSVTLLGLLLSLIVPSARTHIVPHYTTVLSPSFNPLLCLRFRASPSLTQLLWPVVQANQTTEARQRDKNKYKLMTRNRWRLKCKHDNTWAPKTSTFAWSSTFLQLESI